MTTPVYGRTKDGDLGALLGQVAYAAIPAQDGTLRVASGYAGRKALEQHERSDFYGIDADIADEAEFRGYVEEMAEHLREKRTLGRVEKDSRARTPWGTSQGAEEYADGVVRHSTASHGGFKLSVRRNAAVPEPYRCQDGWYEEAVEWAVVAAAFPELFTAHERRSAERTLRNWKPYAYEAVNGVVLAPGESFVKDHDAFLAQHADDLLAISAINADNGMVRVTASRGGDRQGPTRIFLVPREEYAARGPHAFVIDESRHEEVVEAAPAP